MSPISNVVSSLAVELNGKDVGLSTLLTAVDAKTRAAAESALRLQAQYARLASAQGNTAQASAILTSALQNNGGAGASAIAGVATQLTKLQTGTSAIQQFGQSAASSLASIVGPAALASAAIGGLIAVGRSFGEAFKFKAELDATTASINAQLKGVRDTGAVYASAATFARQFKLTQQETTEAIQASIGVMRNSKAPVEDILGVLARMQVLSPEQSLQEAAIALKALASGDTTSLVTRFEVGRDVANQMKQEIQGGADAVAVMSKFLGETGIGMDTLAARTTGAMGAMKELAQAQEQLKLAQAEFAQGPGLAILEGQIRVTSGATRLLSGDFAAMGQSLADAGVSFTTSAAGVSAYLNALATGQGVIAAQIAGNQAAAQATDLLTEAHRNGGGGAFEFAAAENVLVGSMSAESAAAAQVAAAAAVAGQALVDETTKKLDSAAAAEKLAAFQATLASLGGAVAGGMQTAGGAAAFLASRYNIAYDAALKLIGAQAALAHTAVDPLGGTTEGRAERDTPADRAKVKSDQALESNKKLLASIAALDKPPKAGGGAKLSDQQKLNNSLLADQTSADQKSEDAEQDHLKRLLDIQKDFNAKTLAQQQLNEVSKRQSQADFYDRLTSSDLNKKKGGTDALKKIDSDYQAAFQKSQELAQGGQTKLAADYLKLKQDQAQSELTFQENTAKAAAEKDKAEVGRLAAIQALRRQAQAEEEKQLLAGGDANVKAKDAALAEEEAKSIESQDKIATAAERAQQRKVTAALANGKAIDEEQAKVNGLAAAYGTLPPPRGSTAGPGGTIAPAPTVPAAAPAPGDDPVANAISSLRDAIGAVERAVNAGASKVAGAVNSIPRSVT